MTDVIQHDAGVPVRQERHSIASRNRKRVLAGAILLTLGALAIGGLPAWGASGYAITLTYFAAFYVGLGQSWNLMSGLTGYLSVAHAGFLGIGAYTAVILTNSGQSVLVALVAAALVSSVAAVLVGLPGLRVSGLAFAFTTLFFLEICRLVVTLWRPVTGGGAGIYGNTVLSREVALYLMVGVSAAVCLIVLVVRYSQAGRELIAIREDEQAAATIGINTVRLKMAAFIASGALAGVIGATHGLFLGYLIPMSTFALQLTLIAIALPLIGGLATVTGPILAGFAYAYVREQFQIQLPSFHLILLGASVILVVLFMPDGVAPKIGRLLSWTSSKLRGKERR